MLENTSFFSLDNFLAEISFHYQTDDVKINRILYINTT